MLATIGSLALAIAVSSTGQQQHSHQSANQHHRHHHHKGGGFITPRGPGYGWGFPNGNPDGYGWVDYDRTLPLWADRTPEYFFRRQYAVPAHQLFFPTYYNPYISRGQRYLPFSGCGGDHPAGGPPMGDARMPRNPYEDMIREAQPTVDVPQFTGRVESEPQPAGGSGLVP